MGKASLIVVTYLQEGREFVTKFEGEASESAFATWIRVVGASQIVNVRAEV